MTSQINFALYCAYTNIIILILYLSWNYWVRLKDWGTLLKYIIQLKTLWYSILISLELCKSNLVYNKHSPGNSPSWYTSFRSIKEKYARYTVIFMFREYNKFLIKCMLYTKIKNYPCTLKYIAESFSFQRNFGVYIQSSNNNFGTKQKMEITYVKNFKYWCASPTVGVVFVFLDGIMNLRYFY